MPKWPQRFDHVLTSLEIELSLREEKIKRKKMKRKKEAYLILASCIGLVFIVIIRNEFSLRIRDRHSIEDAKRMEQTHVT
jgi:hypothetical protein